MAPRAATVIAICSDIAFGSVTSATTQPAASPTATASRSGASVRPVTVTVQPAAASAAAIARPMPRPPPVTRACRPCKAIALPLVSKLL